MDVGYEVDQNVNGYISVEVANMRAMDRREWKLDVDEGVLTRT